MQNIDMNTNIVEIIRTRLESMGMSQAQFAECVCATPAQMSMFLREKGALSIEAINKSFDLVGVNLSLYSKRNELAKEVASLLLLKNVTSIDNWTKTDLVQFTQHKSISLLFDVKDEQEYLEIEQSGIVDIESTFQYFKALVSYYMTLKGVKPTANRAKQAMVSMLTSSPSATNRNIEKNVADATAEVLTAVAFPLLGAALAAATGLAASKQVGAFSLFAKTMNNSLFAKGISFFK